MKLFEKGLPLCDPFESSSNTKSDDVSARSLMQIDKG